MASSGAGADGGVNGGHPQGTEYTLQGVMRFLQTEWHRHERDRNAWEIERAEMKSRIGRLEGNARTSRRMHESLGKHIKILETALKKEREKVKALSNGEKIESPKDSKEIAKENLKALKTQQPVKPQSSFLNTEGDSDDLTPDFRQDTEREKSRIFLGKCSQEIAYHVIPGSHPPPDINDPQDMSNHVFGNQQMEQPLEYVPPRDKPLHNNVGMVREQSLPNHQPVHSNYSENTNLNRPNQMNQPSISSRELLERRNFEPLPTNENREHAYELHPPADGSAESSHQSFDSFGKDMPKDDSGRQRTAPNEVRAEEPDGWNFDDAPTMNEPSSTEMASLRRPDTDVFPNANFAAQKSPPRAGPGSHRRKSSGAGRRRSEGSNEIRDLSSSGQMADAATHRVRFALRGHLDVIRSVIFTGGGSPSEPEICTCGDDGTLKRWIIPATYGGFGRGHVDSGSDLDITSYFTHRGHTGAVTALASCPPSQNISNGGRVQGDGWVFSGGQDATVRVWERGRVDPKATLDGHTDAVWALCVLPGTSSSVFGERCHNYGGPDRILLAAGASDGRILIWAVSSPPQLTSPQTGSRRQGGSRRANSVSSGSNFPSSPQPSTATAFPFHYTLVHHILRPNSPSPTCISPLSLAGVNFVVSFSDASILVYDTRSGEEVVGMASLETYDGTRSTGVNSVVASTIGFDGTANLDPNRALSEDEAVVHGATGSSGGVEGVIISGYEDRYIRFFDANSGQCTYTMLAHPSAISSLALSPDGRELVSAGHDASLRFWSLEKRSCTQEITSHRLMRGEGVCAVVWSQDGRWVVSGGGDGVVKVFSR
ncbi:hypothetical protein FQN54_009889 [Arachnomyces sp. PD_36]|nr:hypothetical protein FQN54_009889 [Arachnomyces sp. PD_36]